MSPAAALGAAKSLRIKYRPGESLAIVYHSRTDATAKIDGQPADKPVMTYDEQQVELVQSTQAVEPNGSGRVRQQFQRFLLKKKLAQGKEIEFDTRSGEPAIGLAADVGPAYEALLKAHFDWLLDNRGAIVESNAQEQMLAALEKEPDALDALKMVFSEETLKQWDGAGGFLLPEEPVEPGAEWEVPRTLELLIAGKQKAVFHYRYVGPMTIEDRTVDRIEFSVDLDFKPGRLPYDLKLVAHELKGQIDLDAETGRVVAVDQKQTGTFDITVGDEHAVQQFITVSKVSAGPAGNPAPAGPAPRPAAGQGG